MTDRTPLPTNREGITYILSLTLPDGTTYTTSVSRPDAITREARQHAAVNVLVDEWHRGQQYTTGPVWGWKHHRRYMWH